MNKASLTLFAAVLVFAGASTATAMAGPGAAKISKAPATKKVVKKKAATKKAVARKRTTVKKINTANQKLFARRASASKLWTVFSNSMARISGTITIDAAVLPYVSGQCKDVVIKAFGGASTGDEIASMRASGDIYSGTCRYTMFVNPQNEMRVLSFYEGGRSPNHPGDYLEVNGIGAYTFAAAAGRVYERNFVLTYDFIK